MFADSTKSSAALGCFFLSRCSGHCLSVLDQTYPTETSTPAPELRNTQDAVSDPWVLMNSKGPPIDSVGIVLPPPFPLTVPILQSVLPPCHDVAATFQERNSHELFVMAARKR
ncbi:hypothetical protein QC763_0054440 [Podospora pseudopauciseta]|uniref:Uncharacterized protein n=1 Tax=Podospora pseudopauciseta TaxID=2093780 RepID=A0ABR0HGU9_9PEZI|nr:hypothetical protein QC763_0054440 [Podospora pseudopauciseta]